MVFGELVMLLLFSSTTGGINQGCAFTSLKEMNCKMKAMLICPRSGVRTLRETRLAVGRLLLSTGYGPVQPTDIA